MKIAAKVFLIVGIILRSLTIIGPIVGIISLIKLNHPRNTHNIKTWGILSLVFTSVFAGVFILLTKDDELYDGFDKNNCSMFESAKTNLVELKRLRDNGEIDEETYMKKRIKYVEVL